MILISERVKLFMLEVQLPCMDHAANNSAPTGPDASVARPNPGTLVNQVMCGVIKGKYLADDRG